MGNLHIGYDRKNDEKITLPVDALKRHFAALGSSGSGKTVLVKAVMEECIRNDIPIFMIDLQGDLASMAVMGDKDTVEQKGTPTEYWDQLKEKMEVAIYTPASSKGIPISMNPLKAPPKTMDMEDYIQAIDSVAETVANIVGYKTDKGKGAEVKDYLYLLLKTIWDEGDKLDDFDTLADQISEDSFILSETDQNMISDREKEKLAKSIKGLTIGAESLIFNLGMGLDVERMMNWQSEGKVPVNILYLNTLRDQDTKVNFIADAANQVYNWMLRNPSDDVQLVFVLDELAGLVPPVRNPPSKKSIQLLLKQARKYGVSLLLATQNISDVDYKSLGQVSTWALGKLLAKQDIDKVQDIISAISPAETDAILSTLPKQNVGQFMLLNPDVYDSVRRIKTRWLVTEHTTFDDNRVRKVLEQSGIKSRFPEAETDDDRKPTGDEQQKDGSPMTSQEAQESGIVSEGETDPEEKDVAIPSVKASGDILNFLDTNSTAISAEELAARNNEDLRTIKQELESLEEEGSLKSDTSNGVKVYWSKNHEMDPENNIVGPLFEISIKINEGKAFSIMKDNIDKSLWRENEEILQKYSGLFYLPIWRVPVIEKVKEGGFMGIGKKEVDRRRFYYVNALNSSILHYTENRDLKFVDGSEVTNPQKEIDSVPDQIRNVPIQLADLTDEHKNPKISRGQAVSRIKKFTPGYINQDLVPSLSWMPIWKFKVRDKDMGKEREAWIDGLIGSYITDDPTK